MIERGVNRYQATPIPFGVSPALRVVVGLQGFTCTTGNSIINPRWAAPSPGDFHVARDGTPGPSAILHFV
jgi:hypothetical protein